MAATIAGNLFADNNANASWDAGDGRNAGWTVFLDTNNNAALDAGEPSTVTNANGYYSFSVAPGSYTVREVVQPGWRRTSPAAVDHNAVTVADGQTAIGGFGNAPITTGTARITGSLFADNNANASWDAGDGRNAGWRVYLDANNNGAFDATETSALADTNGHFALNNLPAGTHTLRQVLQPGWRRTVPSAVDYNLITLAPGQTGAGGFGNAPIGGTAKIDGTLWADLNGNGAWDAGDSRNGGWTVYLDGNNNGALDGGETTASTDINGHFSILNLQPGTYTVRQVVQPGWVRSYPATTDRYVVTVAGGQTGAAGFGNKRLPGGASISGNLFADHNANASWDAGDGRNTGWRVYVDTNDNAVFDAGEVSTLTDANGAFVIPGLAAGTYKVRQVVQSGWRQTSPRTTDFNLVTVASGGAGVAGFGNTQAVSAISGTAFSDANGNGVRDVGELPLANWAMYVDTNNNGQDDLGERWVTTNALGNFSFTGLPTGAYRVRLIQHHGWTPTAGAQSIVATVDGRNSVGGFAFGARQNPEPASYAADKLVSWITIGGSGHDPSDRGVAWNIEAEGWTGFVETFVQPQLAWGAKRILLHNPFGTLVGEAMQADQAIEAQNAGLNWLLDDFVAAWQPITAQGIEVIAYLGMPRNDASFTGLSEQQWFDRLWQSLDLPLRAGMNIGFDMSLQAAPGDRDWSAVEQLHQRGVRVYGEPRPAESSLHWRAMPLVAEDHVWLETNPELYPETRNWAAKDSQITGEVVRLINHPPPGQTLETMAYWLPGQARGILREGHTVAVEVNGLIERGISMTQILG